MSPPVFDSQGNLFGVTSYGGAAQPRCNDGYDCGVLFKLAPNGTQTVLHAFCSEADCADGAGAMGSLLGDPEETLYGTTVGVDGPGTLYKFDGSFEVLYTFCSEVDCTDGYEPYYENLITDAEGNMFGTAGAGGPQGGGVVFEWSP